MKNKIAMLFGAVIAVSAFVFFGASKTEAAEVTYHTSSSVGDIGNDLQDTNVSSKVKLNTGDTVTITSDSAVDSVYIKWDKDPGSWTLSIGGKDYDEGGYGILHEFVELPEDATSLTITVKQDDCRMCDLWVFKGDTPDFVQKWEPPYEEADILALVAHADDEALFFGPAIINYVDKAAVQVAMFTNFHDSEPIRSHEFYNSLWEMGVRHAPIIGPFYDYYSESLDTAIGQYGEDEATDYVTSLIRRFKPQVVTTHDTNGEYGHGCHMLCAKALMNAIEVSGKADSYPESAKDYGTWTPLKTYIHLWGENQITLDTRTPLDSFGGRTAIEVAREAYKKHESQQWCWFFVEDGIDDPTYQFSCAKFGLYSTSVGTDNNNDFLENITTYADQKAQAQKESAENESTDANNQNEGSKSGSSKFIVPIIIVVIIVLLLILVMCIRVYNKKKRAARRRARRAAQRRKE